MWYWLFMSMSCLDIVQHLSSMTDLTRKSLLPTECNGHNVSKGEEEIKEGTIIIWPQSHVVNLRHTQVILLSRLYRFFHWPEATERSMAPLLKLGGDTWCSVTSDLSTKISDKKKHLFKITLASMQICASKDRTLSVLIESFMNCESNIHNLSKVCG